jgi:ribonuclease MRP protein subunit RMP1
MSKPPQPRLPTKDDLAQLDHFSSLLHLLHHRNQNQHRHSIWYRHFSLFRRHLTALLADYTTLSSIPTSNVERARLKASTPSLHIRISKRLTFWQDVLVARWMRAFSQVVADGRFSVLGLVMLGVLGGVCRVVGVVDGLEAEGQAEIERVLEEFGKEAWGDNGGFGRRVVRGEVDGGEAVARADAGEPVARVDEGEVVAREDVGDGVPPENNEACDLSGDHGEPVLRKTRTEQNEDDEADEARATPSPPPSPPKVVKPKTASTKKRPTETKPKAIKKKRKKGGDAIDDLFSGW